jgi:hypothetical protein
MGLAVHKIILEFFPSRKDGKKSFLGYIWLVISVMITFHFVSFCWIFFRAKDFTTALELINNIGKINFDWAQWLVVAQGYKNVFLLMTIGFIWHYLPESWVERMQKIFKLLPLIFKALLLGLVYWLVYATASAGPQPFIYFQF